MATAPAVSGHAERKPERSQIQLDGGLARGRHRGEYAQHRHAAPGEADAHDRARQGEQQAFGQRELHQIRARRAERHTHAELALPPRTAMWAIFGHGNVAALGEALQAAGDALPTFRGHNEQGMALAACAFAKALRRRRFMAATSSIGPGATNLVTAAAVAHVNRLPLLLLPGDVFASRRPDPVLQQVEDFGDGTVSANDVFRPISRYFDRITRPEQLISALARAMQVLTDPAD